jgi:thymidylate synthase (FAD)
LNARLLWSSANPERLIGLAMRRCYTTKVWEELERDVATPGYSSYLTESAFRRLEFDVYEHVRAVFKVDAEPDEVLRLVGSHPNVSFSSLSSGGYLLSLNLRTLTEMARRIGCDGQECQEFVKFLPRVSPTTSACLSKAGEESSFSGQKPPSAGPSDAAFRVIIVQHLPQGKVAELSGEGLSSRELVKHSFATAEVEGISRACSHQLVRHRLFSYSQESQRFSDAVSEGGVMPPSFSSPEASQVFRSHMEASRKAYSKLRDLGIRKEDARFVLPTALKTKILMTGSAYQILHASFYRSSLSDIGSKAQWEVNHLFTTLYSELKKGDPLLPDRIAEI